jgi:hypothetical protein
VVDADRRPRVAVDQPVVGHPLLSSPAPSAGQFFLSLILLSIVVTVTAEGRAGEGRFIHRLYRFPSAAEPQPKEGHREMRLVQQLALASDLSRWEGGPTPVRRPPPPGGRCVEARRTDTTPIDAQGFGRALAYGDVAGATVDSATRALGFDAHTARGGDTRWPKPRSTW